MRRLPVITSSLGTDGSRIAVQPADVQGRFDTARKIVFVVLVAVYASLPWIHIGGHPAVFLDIARREFFLFGATFNAQDVWLIFFLLTGAGFSLVFLTAVSGRVWCGWACPQTVFLEGIYRRIERWIEGSREQRRRRNSAPLTFEGLCRKVATHSAYVLVSLLLAHVFVSYFVSIPALYRMVRSNPAAHPEAFAWTAGIATLLYGNFAWFREQLCIGICPYGRLQSALTDSDSLVVGYDVKRGEPRGKVSKESSGDCVDCNRCVVVCPTGIDIRNGLQLDCIGCTACIDACDEIMDRVGRERGLVRYDSLNGLEGQPRRLLRPRIAVYAALGLAGLIATTIAMRSRTEFEANVLRMPGPPFRLEDGEVRNAYDIHLVNKSGVRVSLAVDPVPVPGASFVVPLHVVSLGPLESVHAPVFVSVPRADFRREFSVQIRLHPADGSSRAAPVIVTAPFLGPSPDAP